MSRPDRKRPIEFPTTVLALFPAVPMMEIGANHFANAVNLNPAFSFALYTLALPTALFFSEAVGNVTHSKDYFQSIEEEVSSMRGQPRQKGTDRHLMFNVVSSIAAGFFIGNVFNFSKPVELVAGIAPVAVGTWGAFRRASMGNR